MIRFIAAECIPASNFPNNTGCIDPTHSAIVELIFFASNQVERGDGAAAAAEALLCDVATMGAWGSPCIDNWVNCLGIVSSVGATVPVRVGSS